mgnify:CR=1 FL=1
MICIPTGFRLKAQGCPALAGLPWVSVHDTATTPTGLRSSKVSDNFLGEFDSRGGAAGGTTRGAGTSISTKSGLVVCFSSQPILLSDGFGSLEDSLGQALNDFVFQALV